MRVSKGSRSSPDRGHRVERNRSFENQRSGLGTAEIVIHAGAVGARVVGNFVDGADIFDVGDDTQLAGNE